LPFSYSSFKWHQTVCPYAPPPPGSNINCRPLVQQSSLWLL
jgi:hypothetical protein